jgi:hypothetical protein
MKTLTYLALAAGLALASGCGDDAKPAADAAVNSPDGGAVGPDGGTVPAPDGGTVTPEGGTPGMPDGGLAATTLVDFVTGLIENDTTATATPRAVEPEKLTGTDDPAAFNGLLGL